MVRVSAPVDATQIRGWVMRRQKLKVKAAQKVSSHSEVSVGQLPNCCNRKVAGMKA
jgi:hypothetical protein